MLCGILADFVVAVHLVFVLFVVFGGILVVLHRAWARVHLPCVVWGALVELIGWVCPLTPLENWLRQQGGAQGYELGFIEHYVLPILYPAYLTRGHQVALGLLVLGINAGVYIKALRRATAVYTKGPSPPGR